MSEDSSGTSAMPTRRALIGTAMSSYQKIKGKKFTVIIFKGGLAFSQVVTLVVLLILASVKRDENGRRQLDRTDACPRPQLFEAWMAVNAVRLSVCWLVSLWVVSRAPREGEGEEGVEVVGDEGLTAARAQRATFYGERPKCTTSSSAGSFSTLNGNQSGSITPHSPLPLGSSCCTLSAGLPAPSGSIEKQQPEQVGMASQRPRMSSRLATGLDKAAPRISSCLAIISLALFITGNILVFSPLPSSNRTTCKDDSPLLWWGVMAVVSVGWFLLAQVVLIVGVVGIGGSAVMALLRAIHLVSPLPVPIPPREPPPPPLTAVELSSIRIASYGSSDTLIPSGQTSCLVCLNDYTHGEALRVLTCLHCYHPDCIDPWLVNSSARCPACNASVVPL